MTTNIKAAFSTETSARLAAENGLGQMFVAGDDLDAMTEKVRQFNEIRAELGLPPDQPTTLLWMYCAETSAEAEEGWEYFRNQLLAAQHHYFEWNNPGFKGIKGYEEYEHATPPMWVGRRHPGRPPGHAAHRDTGRDHRQAQDGPMGHQPRDPRDPLLLRRHAGEKAERSLRLFAEKVLPAVHQMDTPINPASLGRGAG